VTPSPEDIRARPRPGTDDGGRPGKLCGAFLVDQAFENYMKIKSGLKFDKCDETDFRAFVNDEWEYTMKRNFGIDEDQDTFVIRPPAKAVGALKKIRNHDSFRLSK